MEESKKDLGHFLSRGRKTLGKENHFFTDSKGMHQGLQKVISFYENIHPESYRELGKLFADNFEFIDYAHQTKSLEQLTQYYQGMFKLYKNPQFKFHEFLVQGDKAVLFWTFSFERMGMSSQVEGAWKLTFDSEEKIICHKDYWDLSTQVYEKLPFIGHLFRWLRLLLLR